jgi:hypothetical protein
MQCKARTCAGIRCKNQTCNYQPTCHVHRHTPDLIVDHELVPGLYVQRSNIKGAGLGLFTPSPIAKGATIGLYGGALLGASGQGSYVMQCGRGASTTRVDARDPDLLDTSVLRFINTWRAGSMTEDGTQGYNNVSISGQSVRNRYCKLRATRRVAAGRELLLAYGRCFHVPR